MTFEEAREIVQRYADDNDCKLADAIQIILDSLGCGCGLCLAHNNFKCPKLKEVEGK